MIAVKFMLHLVVYNFKKKGNHRIQHNMNCVNLGRQSYLIHMLMGGKRYPWNSQDARKRLGDNHHKKQKLAH